MPLCTKIGPNVINPTAIGMKKKLKCFNNHVALRLFVRLLLHLSRVKLIGVIYLLHFLGFSNEKFVRFDFQSDKSQLISIFD